MPRFMYRLPRAGIPRQYTAPPSADRASAQKHRPFFPHAGSPRPPRRAPPLPTLPLIFLPFPPEQRFKKAVAGYGGSIRAFLSQQKGRRGRWHPKKADSNSNPFHNASQFKNKRAGSVPSSALPALLFFPFNAQAYRSDPFLFSNRKKRSRSNSGGTDDTPVQAVPNGGTRSPF